MVLGTNDRTSRRNIIKLTGAASVAALAGCTGDDDPEDSDDGSDSNEYPTQDIRFIVPFGQGGGTDQYQRTIMPEVGNVLGVNIQVENMPGASSMLGLGEMIESDPDGYTVAAFNMPSSPLSSLINEAPFDLSNVRGVATYARSPNVMIVNPDIQEEYGIYDYEDVIDAYNNGDIDAIGGQARGGIYHVMCHVLRNDHDLAWEDYVAYESSGETSQAVASGEVPIGVGTDAGSGPIVESGEAELVNVLTSYDSEVFPDADTIVDVGFDESDWVTSQQRGVWMPPETPDEVVNTYTNAIEEALETDAVQEWSEETGNAVVYAGPDEADATLEETFDTIDEQVDLEEMREAEA